MYGETDASAGYPKSDPVTPADIVRLRQIVDEIYVDDKIRDYIIELVFATREPKEHDLPDLENLIEYGGSPRASIADSNCL